MNPLVAAGPDVSGSIPVIDQAIVAEYVEAGWWGTRSVGDIVHDHAQAHPDGIAITSAQVSWTWEEYDRVADEVAAALLTLRLARGSRVAVFLPDGPAIHGVVVGCARSGHVAVGIGARAGDAELEHLITRTAATVIVTAGEHRGRRGEDIVAALARRGVRLDHHVVVDDAGVCALRALEPGVNDLGQAHKPTAPEDQPTALARAFGPSEISMLNSTSGTTGLPKCVTQFDNRWIHFSQLAIEAGDLTPEDVILAAVPTPFGFGLWTSHHLGPVLGARTIVMPRFSAEEILRLIERERVTVLCCVTTQFRMLLNSPMADEVDLSSMRVMFTGGEVIPVDRAIEFERRTGAALLQFFGSNESGAFSYTTLGDSQEKRLTTSGRLIPHMSPRIFDDAGQDVAGPGTVGTPGGRGPLTCAGYFNDDGANEQLFTADGWLLMGDLVQLDDDGYLCVVGRTSDIIIRGGKNISAVEVENHIESHPDIALVSVVAVPDPVFGERVCAVAAVRPGAEVSLPGLVEHLETRGVSREWFPERLLIVPELPRSSGGKIAKSEVRKLALHLLHLD